MRMMRSGLAFCCLLAIGIVLPSCSGLQLDTAENSAPNPPRKTLDLGNGVSMEFALIPAGTFKMGSSLSAEQTAQKYGGQVRYFEIEHPQHTVKISKPFYMGVTEVTQEQYEAVMGSNPSHSKGAKNPVENISWYRATAFCKKMAARTGKAIRLPTEAEWEYACRAGSTGCFSFGDSANQLGEYAWYNSNSNRKVHSVGRKKPNGWGLYDMHGNVYEWCQDWCAKYSIGTVTDPTGPTTVSHRVLRGGFRTVGPRRCRSASRYWSNPSLAVCIFGFRVVCLASVGMD